MHGGMSDHVVAAPAPWRRYRHRGACCHLVLLAPSIIHPSRYRTARRPAAKIPFSGAGGRAVGLRSGGLAKCLGAGGREAMSRNLGHLPPGNLPRDIIIALPDTNCNLPTKTLTVT